MIFDPIINAWKQATTEGDNTTTCPVRLGAIGTALVYHVAATYMVFGQKTAIDAVLLGQYIQHMAMLIGVTAGGIGAKAVLKGDAA